VCKIVCPDRRAVWQRPDADNQGVDEKQRTRFDDLHRSIGACDDVLNSVELNLTSFRNDLASVSADIEFLQSRSTALTRRLDNRRSVEKALGPLVEELSIPPEAISKLAEGHIDESWAKMLNEIDRRAVAHEKRSSGQQNKALEDLGPLLEKLVAKVGHYCYAHVSLVTDSLSSTGYRAH